MAFLADALAAFGDGDTEDLRRVKTMVVLANPAKAVGLLAAFAALRARTVYEPLDGPQDGPIDRPQDEPAVEPLTRMDAFASRVGSPTWRPVICKTGSAATRRLASARLGRLLPS